MSEHLFLIPAFYKFTKLTQLNENGKDADYGIHRGKTDPAVEETEEEDPLRILELLLDPGSEDMAASGKENSPFPPSPTEARSARRRGQDRSERSKVTTQR